MPNYLDILAIQVRSCGVLEEFLLNENKNHVLKIDKARKTNELKFTVISI